MEEDALGARRVLEDRVNRGDRAAEVLEIECDRDVDQRRAADAGIGVCGGAIGGIAEERGSPEGESTRRRVGGRESEVSVEVRGSDGFSWGKGLERRGEDDDGQ